MYIVPCKLKVVNPLGVGVDWDNACPLNGWACDRYCRENDAFRVCQLSKVNDSSP